MTVHSTHPAPTIGKIMDAGATLRKATHKQHEHAHRQVAAAYADYGPDASTPTPIPTVDPAVSDRGEGN